MMSGRERKETSKHGVSVRIPKSHHARRPLIPLSLEERDSPRDQWVVTFFILIVAALLLTAAIRNRYVLAEFIFPVSCTLIIFCADSIKRSQNVDVRRTCGRGARSVP
jgi:hypothetical protein